MKWYSFRHSPTAGCQPLHFEHTGSICDGSAAISSTIHMAHSGWRRAGRIGSCRLLLISLLVSVCVARAQTPLQTINLAQGGRIVYGKVDGADTQGAAMTTLLRNVHKNCGEKPQIGRVFKMRGTDSVGVFFTVVNHPAGNVQVAGLIIAAGSGPHGAEAALVSDSAGRFGSTINPMLTKLFSVWHPGGEAPSSQASSGQAATSSQSTQTNPASASGTATGGHSAPAAPLEQVTLPDNTASVGIPDGWRVDPGSGGGTVAVTGPHGEKVGLNMTYSAVDPGSQTARQLHSYAPQALRRTLLYPYNADLVKGFPDLFQAIRRLNGLGPAKLEIAHGEQLPAPQGVRSVHVSGQVTLEERGTCEFETVLSMSTPVSGMYTISVCSTVVPNAVADQQRATVDAIAASFRANLGLLNEQRDRMIADQTRRAIDNFHQIGRNAAARYAATDAANTAQHEAFHQRQDDISRNGQGFSNYLLDQTVIRDVQSPDSHATVWNRTAEFLKKAYPDRIEEVPTSQYIKGQDF